MTVSAFDNAWDYVGDGASTSFAYLNRVFAASDIKAYADGVLVGSGYSVSGVDNPTGGAVVFSVAPAAGVKIALRRVVPASQGTQFPSLGKFPAQLTEKALDRVTVLAQQAGGAAERAIHPPASDPADISMTLPAKASRLGKALGFDPTTGNPVVSTKSLVQIETEADAAAASASAAATSATAAAASASSASASQTAAATSASNAATSASSASASQSAAATSASNAATSASSASASQSAAATSATNAASSASSASASQSAAATSAANAATSASTAATSATNATTSETNAAASAAAAATSAYSNQYAVCTGSNDALVAAAASAWSSYTDGLELRIKSYSGAASTSTTPTINVSALGAKTIVKSDGSALAVGDIASSGDYTLRYNSTSGKMHLIADKASPPTAGTGISVSGAQVSLAQMAANTLKGNNTGGTANAADLTVAQAQSLLGIAPLDYCVVTMSADQTGIADAVTTKLNFDQTQDGRNSAYVDATNKRFKPTVASTWIILPYIQLELYSPSNGCNYAWLTKNGTKQTGGGVGDPYSPGGWLMDTMPVCPCVISFNGSTDYADMWGNFDTNGVSGPYNIVRSALWLCNSGCTQMLCIRVA